MTRSPFWSLEYLVSWQSRVAQSMICGLMVLFLQGFPNESPVYADDFTDKCRGVMSTTIELSDIIGPKETKTATRTRILQLASTEAISATVGAHVAGRTDYALEGHNEEVDERFANRMKVQSQGLVRQKVVKEGRTEVAGQPALILTIEAEVCIPLHPTLLKDLVSLISFVDSTKAPSPLFATVVAHLFSNSAAYIISKPSDTLVDYQISGQLGAVTIEVVERSRGKGSQPIQLKRAQGTATLVAKQLMGDQSLITHHVEDFQHYRVSMSDKAVTDEFTQFLIEEVSTGLHDKLLAKRPDASDIPQSAQERAPLPAF